MASHRRKTRSPALRDLRFGHVGASMHAREAPDLMTVTAVADYLWRTVPDKSANTYVIEVAM
jgi:hypothetical protein